MSNVKDLPRLPSKGKRKPKGLSPNLEKAYNMTKNIDKVRATVAKLIALAQDVAATEAVAAGAMAKAQKLMEQYGVTEEDIVTRPDEIDFEERYADHTRKHMHPVDTLLGNTIAKYCGVMVWTTTTRRDDNTRTAVYYGIDSDVELAMFLRHSLMKSIDYGWDIYRRFERDPNDSMRVARRSFMLGFAKVLIERMEAFTKAVPSKGKELICLKNQLVAEAFAEKDISLSNHRGKRRPNGINADAYHRGKAVGGSAELGRGVGGKVAGLLS